MLRHICQLQFLVQTIKKYIYRPQHSCGKVMFSQASVILFIRGVSVSVHAGIDPPLQVHPPPTTVTAADGTHPTGMLSCLRFISARQRSYGKVQCVPLASSVTASTRHNEQISSSLNAVFTSSLTTNPIYNEQFLLHHFTHSKRDPL